MKKCAVCSAIQPEEQRVCDLCGEASWILFDNRELELALQPILPVSVPKRPANRDFSK